MEPKQQPQQYDRRFKLKAIELAEQIGHNRAVRGINRAIKGLK